MCTTNLCFLQDQMIHRDAGVASTLSLIVQLIDQREWHIFNGHDMIQVVCNPGDILIFNHNVYHRGTTNSHESTCIFMYFDKEKLDAGWAFSDLYEEEDYHAMCDTPEFNGCRHFVYEEAISLKEVPCIINNAYRDPAFVKNITSGK